MFKCFYLYLIIGLLLSACDDSTLSDDCVQSTSLLPVDSLFLSDSIGVLMGDSCYVFGEIRDIECVPEGIAVLDAIFCRISVFSDDGEFLYSGGRQGGGPGEFSYPTNFCRLSTGDSFVFDFGDRSVTILNDSLEYITSYNIEWGTVLNIVAAQDSMIVMKQFTMEFIDEKLFAGYRISSTNAYTGEEVVVYREHLAEMGASEVDIRQQFCFFTADDQGNVYLADYDSDHYRIDILSAAGDTLRRLELESEIRPAFDIESHQLIFLPLTIPLTTNSGTSTFKITAPELHPYVTFMNVDEDDNIWVRRMGLVESEYWDVLSQTGDVVRKVVLYADSSESSGYPALHISENGIVATRNEFEVERFYTVD